MATYELLICNDRGRRIGALNMYRTFSASASVNSIGSFDALLKQPVDIRSTMAYHWLERDLRRDWQIQVWRKDRGPMRLWRTYFVTRWGWSQSEDGEEVFSLGGYDANHLLTRRIVAAYSQSALHSLFIANPADDVMKALVIDSMTNTVDPTPTAGTRAWADLSVQTNHSLGAAVTIDEPFARLLTLSGGGVLPEIARASREAGTPLFFWVAHNTISTAGVTFQFRTAINQPGRDLTSGRGKVLFSAGLGTLVNWELEYDHSEEVNYVYGLGQGDEADLNVQQVYDADRYQASTWARCEGTAEASDQELDAGVIARANAALSEGRPRVSLRGETVSTPGQAFGRHYDVGDRVLARAKGKQFEAIVAGALISIDEDGAVTEQAKLEIYDE